MDVDNGPFGQNGQNGDLEQSLLQQFSCMGTTDRDELISQLQKLLGNNLNETTASFFLDMNNWNLQAAVGSYFDCDSPMKMPSMILLADVTFGEGEGITPMTRFVKTWRIQNNGDEPWPYGCCLQLSGSTGLQCPEKVSVAPLSPGQVQDISIEMQSPAGCGVFQSKFRLCTNSGSFFGDTIWAIVTVSEGGTMALTQQLAHLSANDQNSTDEGSSASGMSGSHAGSTEHHRALGMAIPLPDVSRPSTLPLFQNSIQSEQSDNDSHMC